MKRLLLFSLLLGLFLPAQAQNEEIQYRCQVVKASQAPKSRIMTSSDWTKFLASSQNMVLDEVGGIAQVKHPFLNAPVTKLPIPYKDPRPNMYQVQYVDIGLKLDTHVKPYPNGKLLVIARGERSLADPHPELEQRTQVFIFESETIMKRGQVAVFGGVNGPLARKHLKKQFPDLAFSETDTLLFVVSVK